MTPDQIALVEATLASLDLDALAADFYRRAIAGDPSLSAMFTSDPTVQRARFGAELAEIVCSIRSLDAFASTARSLGRAPPRLRRARRPLPAHGRGAAGRTSTGLGEAWTADVEEAWMLAYNLTAETMMMGAAEDPSPR